MSEALGRSAVSGDIDRQVAEVVAEITDRLHGGESVDVAGYITRYPELADRLRPLLAALDLLARFSSSGGAGEESAGAVGVEEMCGTLGDFRIVREVGRGGMGIVYEAEQISLGRRVALKVLPFAATMDPRHLQRFHNEARAAASLDHPHIVHVHAVGCERAVHFYAMQFIDGQTLAATIADLRQRGGKPAIPQEQPTTPHVPVAPAADTAERAAASTERPALGAAYFRRVAEWGIQAAEALDHAHQLGIVHRDMKPANLLVDGRGGLWVTDFGLAHIQSDVRLTMTGDLVGTLRYMSPEQALAKRVVIDHRTDVYSLGATLYELLTLEPAFTGIDRQELLRQIAFEEPKVPRRVNKAIPAELETIVLKAMEKNPAERYTTANELASDLRRFLVDEPIRARPAGVARRLRKWSRRHRAAVATAAVCLLVTVPALVGGAGWVMGDRSGRRREAEGKVQEALAEAVPGLRAGDPQDPTLIAALQRAEAQMGTGVVGPGLRAQVEQLRRDRDMLAQLEEARMGRAENPLLPETERSYVAAFVGYGLDVTTLSHEKAADRVRASSVCDRLIVALDDWALVRHQLKQTDGELREVANLADDDPWRRRLRAVVEHRDRAALEGLAGEDETSGQPPANMLLLARALTNAGSWAAAERLLRGAQAGRPGDVGTNFDLADCLLLKNEPPRKKSPDAAELAEAIRSYQAALALRPRSHSVYYQLGYAFQRLGRWAEAEVAYRKAIDLKPDDTNASSNLFGLLQDQGKDEEAIAVARQAIAVNDGAFVRHNSIGVILLRRGDLDEAAAEFREAIRLKPNFVAPHLNLGLALERLGRLAEAQAAFRRGIALQPDNATFHSALGNALNAQGKKAEAEAAYRKASEIEQGKKARAEAACRKAVDICPDDPVAHFNLGNTLRSVPGHVDEAIRELRDAIRLKQDYAEAHTALVEALSSKGDRDGAIAECREAIRLEKDDPEAHFNLGFLLMNCTF
jgi:serine/threonine protein kinase/tetratricopeptide (TPR) repeat protein